MAYFKDINFNNYRNFSNFNFNFESGCNIILGKNGSGKTNVLEGLSLFEKGRGFRKEKIINLINIQNKKNEFIIKSIVNTDKLDINAKVYSSEKKSKKLSINDSTNIDSIKNFESLFSIIYFLPEMERLFLSSPSIRRNFLDRLIFTYDKNYHLVINQYKKNINERQYLLKKDSYDESWINKLENNIVNRGINIYQKRLFQIKILNENLKIFSKKNHFFYNYLFKLSDQLLEKNIRILDDSAIYISELRNNRLKDIFSGGCTVGPHRSDLIGFNKKNDFNLSQLSTGQQKTIVLLLIIFQSKYLITNLNLKPVILLDEVCSHLDYSNRELLLHLSNDLKVQTFMTGAEEKFFSFLSTKANYCNIN